mgnify:CR=1 FL=1
MDRYLSRPRLFVVGCFFRLSSRSASATPSPPLRASPVVVAPEQALLVPAFAFCARTSAVAICVSHFLAPVADDWSVAFRPRNSV